MADTSQEIPGRMDQNNVTQKTLTKTSDPLNLFGGRNMFTDPFGSQEAARVQEAGQERALQEKLGVIGDARGNIQGNLQNSLGAIYGGAGQGAEALGSGYQDAFGQLGAGYGQARSDLAGAGPNALSQLYGQDPYGAPIEESAAYQFRREQGEQGLERAAAARGGRGGGRAMKDQMRFNQGLASQEADAEMQRRFAQRGQNIGLAGGIDQMNMNRQGQLSGLASQYGQQGAGLSTGLGSGLAGIYGGAGQNAAGLYQGASGHEVGLADAMLQSYQQRADAVGMTEQGGANSMLGIGKIVGSIFSDERLKMDVLAFRNSPYDRIGLRGYTWTWNDRARDLGLRGRSQGVIAQQVLEKYPQAVGELGRGYLSVNYGLLNKMVSEAN